jgi:SRSO17 transposase
VHRQYAPGSLRVGNAQVAVLMAYVTPRGRALVDRELYLPEEWILDTDRARRAGVPPDLAFASKPDLAIRMIERAVNAHRNMAWVVADGIIGESTGLRAWLQERPLGYVLPARGDELVVTRDGAAGEAAALSDTLAESAWTPIAAKPTSRRAPVDWARIMLGGGELTGEGDPWDQSLLIGRSAGHPAQLDYYQCHAPAGTALARLVRVAGATGAVRECVEFANNNLGLDHYQVRRYEPWYRHVTLCMLAAATVAVADQLR